MTPALADPLQKSDVAVPVRARGVTATPGLAPSPAVQRLQEASRALNARPEVVAQRALGKTLSAASTAQRAPVNRTGLPDALKAGVEALSGVSMDDVRVHRNSSAPSTLQAHAYAQGSSIHLAPGQERHLPHEAWHVAQQKQGRVKPTMQLRGVGVNDDTRLEHEADVMGARALQAKQAGPAQLNAAGRAPGGVVQRAIGFEFETGWLLKAPANAIGMHTAVIRGTGWELVPDRVDYTQEELAEMGIGPGRTHTGSGAMEFVTRAFDENEVGPGEALEQAMQEIAAVCTILENASRGFFGDRLDVPLNRVIGGGVSWGAALALPVPAPGEHLGTPEYQARLQRANERRDNILVRRLGPLISAPQMTGGIKHDQLIHLLERMSGGAGPPAPGGQARPSATLLADSDPAEVTAVQGRAGNARQVAGWEVADGTIQPHQQAAYAGFVALLGSYVRLARMYQNPPYDKAITPLLSRTDFGQIPDWARGVPHFVNDVLLASGRYGGGTRNDMAVEGNDKLFVEPGRHDNISTRGWLQAIVAGHDLVGWEQDQGAAHWQPQQVGAAPNTALGHVYEFRRLRKGIPAADWRTYAMEMADLVVRANTGGLQ